MSYRLPTELTGTHRALIRTFIDQLNRFLLSRRIASRGQWTGQSNSDSTVPPTLQQMFALVLKMGYEMHAGWIAHANHLDRRERPPPLVKDTVHHSGPVVTFLESSASVVVNSDILRLVARGQTRLFRTNRPVGICNLIINNIRTSLHRRETLFRPGNHPYRSECNTSGLHFVFTPWSDISYFNPELGYHRHYSKNWLRQQELCSVFGQERYWTDRRIHNSDCWWFDCTWLLCIEGDLRGGPFACGSGTYRFTDWPVRTYGYWTCGWFRPTDFGSGTLVPRRMDRRPFGEIFGRLGILGNSHV